VHYEAIVYEKERNAGFLSPFGYSAAPIAAAINAVCSMEVIILQFTVSVIHIVFFGDIPFKDANYITRTIIFLTCKAFVTISILSLCVWIFILFISLPFFFAVVLAHGSKKSYKL
jgi:hypothetical protein